MPTITTTIAALNASNAAVVEAAAFVMAVLRTKHSTNEVARETEELDVDGLNATIVLLETVRTDVMSIRRIAEQGARRTK